MIFYGINLYSFAVSRNFYRWKLQVLGVQIAGASQALIEK